MDSLIHPFFQSLIIQFVHSYTFIIFSPKVNFLQSIARPLTHVGNENTLQELISLNEVRIALLYPLLHCPIISIKL